MFQEIDDLDVFGAICGVSDDEATIREMGEQRVDIGIVIRHELEAYSFWPVFQPTFAVRHAPQPDEKIARF